jgi:NAD(P)-dependent dehydrogenase (short-subunit alcohol dehydrogenase family)
MSATERNPKAALVTGAAKRIGRSIAVALAQDGWDVAVHYHVSRDEAEEVVREVRAHGVHAMALGCNLADAQATARLIGECRRKLGALSLLVNNASLFEFDDLESLEAQRWDRHQAVNVRAPVMLARDFALQLSAQAQGCVINMLDQKVFNLNPDFVSYTVSKMALEAATRMLALALAPRVRVCAIAPGITLASAGQSPGNFEQAHRMAPLGKSSELGDLVQALRYLVSAGAVTGITLIVDGGQHLWPSRRDVQFEVK